MKAFKFLAGLFFFGLAVIGSIFFIYFLAFYLTNAPKLRELTEPIVFLFLMFIFCGKLWWIGAGLLRQGGRHEKTPEAKNEP